MQTVLWLRESLKNSIFFCKVIPKVTPVEWWLKKIPPAARVSIRRARLRDEWFYTNAVLGKSVAVLHMICPHYTLPPLFKISLVNDNYWNISISSFKFLYSISSSKRLKVIFEISILSQEIRNTTIFSVRSDSTPNVSSHCNVDVQISALVSHSHTNRLGMWGRHIYW